MNESPDNSQPSAEQRSLGETTPAPLDYESPRDRMERQPATTTDTKAFAFILGFLAAAIAIFCANLPYANSHFDPMGSAPDPDAASVFFALTLIPLFLLLRMVRTPGWTTARRWALLGTLVGAGVSLLLSGICYSMS